MSDQIAVVVSEETISGVFKEVQQVVTNEYDKLLNLPTLNGVKIIGNIDEKDPTVPDWAKQPSKPRYTARETGAVDEDSAIKIEELANLFE